MLQKYESLPVVCDAALLHDQRRMSGET